MNRPVSTLAFALLAMMVAATAYAQFMPKRIWTLTVVVNVPGAVIFVDNQQLPGNQTRVPGGAHNVQVMADGYLTFNASVMMNGDQTFPVNLQPVPPAQPAGFPLSINVNVPDAAVFVDGVQVQGVPIVAPGPHSVQVAAPGYQDYSTSVNVMRPLTLNVVLNPLDRPSTLTFVIPRPYLDPDMHPDDPRSAVRIFIDGMLVNPHSELERIAVQPGRHRIRVASGAFSVELGDMEVRPRTNYVLELGMDVKVRVSREGAY